MPSSRTRILLVEDSALDAALFEGLLRHVATPGLSITRAATLREARTASRSAEFDLIVLDLGLPDATGLDSLRLLRADGVTVPILVLTATEDDALGLSTIQAGAQDYLAKSELGTSLLVRSIRYAIERDRLSKEAEEKLRASEAQLRQFIREAPLCVAMFDRQMIYLAASQQWVEAYGQGRGELTGLCHYDLYTDLPERWKTMHRRSLAGECLREDRDRWELPDGSVQFLRWAIHPWHGPAGDIAGIIITCEDTTERVRAEEALLFTQNLMRETGHIAKVGGWEFDVETGNGYWTEEVARIHELDIDIAPDRNFGLSFYAPESRSRLVPALQQAMERGTPYDLELEIRTAKGNHRWIRTIAHPILKDGKVIKIQGSFQDITDRRLSEDKLRLQASLIEQAYDAVFVWQREGAIHFWNRAAERIYGYSKAEAIGRVSHQLLQTSTEGGIEGVLESLAQTGKWEGELHHTRRDGRRIIVESRMIQISEAGRAQILETNRDVTEQRLLEDQLRQAVKMEAIGRLAGGVAHDFNNLLGVILGSAELLATSKDWEAVRTRAGEIESAAKRAANLTRQLLAFSRKQVLEPKILDLNARIREMADMLGRIVGEDVRFSFQLSPDAGRAKLDPSQVEQILLNLVVNARDAMPNGGAIVVETENASLDETYCKSHSNVTPGRYVMLAVSDSGVGMDAHTQAHIFEPFFTTKASGTGLGLATVYGAVKQSGGHIWLYSELGKGTTFKIYFPLVEEEASEFEQPPAAPARSSCSETVLLVEDSESLREITKQFLQLAGYVVADSCNAAEALRFAREHPQPIHLLLTDVVMPGMNGRELAGQFQQLHPETRVLYMSGYTANAIHHHGVLDEGIALLPKPFTRASLTEKVRELLDAGSSPSSHSP